MKITLLTEEEVFGENKLDIIKKYGAKAKATDFAIATGVWTPDLDSKIGWYWLKTPYNGYARAVNYNGHEYFNNTNNRYVGVRPALEFQSIDEIISLGGVIIGDKLILGVYDDTALSKNDQIKWTNALANGELKECGEYPLDSVKYDYYSTPYNPIKVPIYEYNGRRTIRIKINSSFDGKYFKLSNGEKYKDGDYAWFEIKDWIWLFDIEKLKAISEKICLGGIQFDKGNNYQREEDFPNTNMGKYLNDIFLPTLMQFQNKTLDDLNKDELLKKIQSQQEYIKSLESEIESYKKAYEKLSEKMEEISNTMSDVSKLILK